ncbi:hypothetical protein QOZ80_3AG0227740 [Eleusine coracana subsp. coracana]|nr:hypothetical protein QOZ80_3AG0227740 [Eleusine coracana subsp. coracana]
MSNNKPRALKDLMTAVDAGHVIDSDNKKLLAPRRSSYSRRRQSRLTVVAETPPDETSFEFSAVVSNSSASPASMVFSEGQLRAHQYPAVHSSAANSKVASLTKSSGAMGTKKRVSFATDKTAATKAGGGQGKKSGGLLGCMSSACGSSRNEVVEPAKNANRKMVAAV